LFWESAWLDGQAPRDIAPSLYKLAWRKSNSVAEDLSNDNWTRGLWRMNTAEAMAELIMLWERIQEVQVSDQQDTIRWRWTASGVYSVKSAYLAQFKGSYCTFNYMAIWQAKVEGKHRFFAWLLLQCKLLTADRLLSRNWPCDPICILCDQAFEMAEHLCLHCVYARQVWHLVSTATAGRIRSLSSGVSVELWWNNLV
jgi:hypothetical protein